MNATDSARFELLSNITTEKAEKCLILHFEEYVPWNNSESIAGIEVEEFTRQLKDVFFLPALCLIAFPANIINMIVFYKQGLTERINVCLFALSLADELYMINNLLWYGEQLEISFTTKEISGPVLEFIVNNNLLGFHGFIWVSQLISAMIASERCFCVLQPLRSQTVLRTSTTTAIIVAIHVIILGLVFFEVSRYRIVCAYDSLTDKYFRTTVPGEFYLRHQKLIDYLDVFVLGAALPGVVIIVVVVTTIITTIKLRKAAQWRSGTSTSGGLSSRDIALTKMLVSNSVFFIVCATPFFVFRFVFLLMPEVNIGRRQHNLYITLNWILMIISYFNATFNIVVYYTMGSRFRETFWQLLGKSVNKEKR